MTPDFLSPWTGLARTVCSRYSVVLEQVLALIWQESAGNPRAYRFEQGFWAQYLDGRAEWTRGLTGAALESWIERCSASYGLMQIMFPTACDHGLSPSAEPEFLFQPSMCLDYGIRHWKLCLTRAGGNVRDGFLRWNGGGRMAYADEAFDKLATLTAPPAGGTA